MNNPENRSTVVEQRLADYGITPDLVALPLGDIDASKSLHLQNRGAVRLDDDNVLQMAVHLEVADDRLLPPIVVARYHGKLIVVDGNHRRAAYAMTGRSHIDAYLVDGVAPEVVEQLVLEANAANGRGLTPEERLQQALRYADLTGDLKMAAARFGYRYDTLAVKKRAAQGMEKARRAAGVRAALPDTKAEALNRLDEDQIKALGRDLIERADSKMIKEAAANITAVPASERAMQTATEAGKLAQSIRDKKTPAGKARAKVTGPTLKAAHAQLRRILGQVRANPSWRADGDLRALADQLAEEVRGGNPAHNSAA